MLNWPKFPYDALVAIAEENMSVSLFDAPASLHAVNAAAAVRDYKLNPTLGTLTRRAHLLRVRRSSVNTFACSLRGCEDDVIHWLMRVGLLSQTTAPSRVFVVHWSFLITSRYVSQASPSYCPCACATWGNGVIIHHVCSISISADPQVLRDRQSDTRQW